MKFRKKPVVITAEQWDGTSENAQFLIEWVCQEGHLDATFVQDSVKTVICIPTLEGVMTAMPDDWIIRGVNGEFYPCKPDIFAASYEPFEPEAAADPREPDVVLDAPVPESLVPIPPALRGGTCCCSGGDTSRCPLHQPEQP